jgi:hypothetical protein
LYAGRWGAARPAPTPLPFLREQNGENGENDENGENSEKWKWRENTHSNENGK